MDNHVKRKFPAWHFSMLNDVDRNSVIEAAIREAGVAGKTVFEIGTGAGLTAMLFARYGAREIITCELDEQLYRTALSVFKINGLSAKITALNKSSSDVVRDGFLPFVPDFIFTETLDCGVVGEGFASIRADIIATRGRDTVVLPGSITQYGYLVESYEMHGLNSVHEHCGFDLSPLNNYRTRSYFPVRAAQHRPKALTPVVPLRTFSYTDSTKAPARVVVEAHIDGLCHGIVSFFEAQFGRYVVTNDLRSLGHWHQAFHPFYEPVTVYAGQRYAISIAIDGAASLSSLESMQELSYEQA